MLDDIAQIEAIDVDDAIGVNGKLTELLNHDFKGQVSFETAGITNIVVAGMGGSNQPALFAKDWLAKKLTVPLDIIKEYDIPASVGPNTLFIASSYSGNTEESLSALAEAEKVGAKIVIIAAGGKLAQIAAEKSYPFFELTTGVQPRYALFNAVKAHALVFEQCGLAAGIVSELQSACEAVEPAIENWQKSVPTESNLAKQIALKLQNTSVVMYAGPTLRAAAYRWKITINENAKNVAWFNEWPEFNHNEFIGWSSHPKSKPYGVVELQSSLDNERIAKRFEISNKLLDGMMPKPIEVQAEGATQLEQLLWSIKLGDFVSLYLAMLNGVNQTPVDLVEQLKKELG